jgi:hypothetical protein
LSVARNSQNDFPANMSCQTLLESLRSLFQRENLGNGRV